MTKKKDKLAGLVKGVDYIVTEDGRNVNPETGKELKGFALNRAGINTGGRPKGARNKSSLMKAQYQLDEDSVVAAKILRDLMMNDKEALGVTSDVPPTVRMAAAKEVLNKAIANEKDKIESKPTSEGKTEEVAEDDDTPIVMNEPYEVNA